MPKTERAAAPAPLTHVELDFADNEIVVREFPDGMFTIAVNEERLVVNAAEMQTVVGAFMQLGKTKGWT